MTNASHISPFKFLDSYTKEDRDLFFGREREVEELYSKIFQSKLLLVYGASGTGKSSIINCGLANKLNEEDWLPLHIRRGNHMTSSLYQQLSKWAITPLPVKQQGEVNSKDLKDAISSIFLDYFKPIYLIFDQFEELFVFGYKDEWLEFIRNIKIMMESDLDVHFVFVMRGEYLEFLSEFEEVLPGFFDNRIRIEKMTRQQAKESILGPCKVASINLEEGFEERLLKKLSPDKSHIELTFLQVFLDKIYKNAKQITANDQELLLSNHHVDELGKIGDILAEFVDEQLFKMEDSQAALTVLKSFVSLQGTKAQRSLDEVNSYTRDIGTVISPSQIEEIVSDFVNKRILKEKDDNDRYELRHDSLAQKIYEKITHQERELLDVKQFLEYSLNEYTKRGTLLKDEDLLYISPYERALVLDDEAKEFIELSKRRSSRQKKVRRTRTIIIAVIILLMITSVSGFFYSQEQKSRAEELYKIAERESRIAQEQREIAEEARIQAETSAEEATLQAGIAAEQRNEALKQSEIATQQRTIAEQQTQEAEEARNQAILSEKDALTQKQIAEEERKEAYRLRMLTVARELAIKSTYTLTPDLKALLAVQAHQFNQEYEGNAFHPELYNALYLASKSNKLTEKIRQYHSLAITGIETDNELLVTAGHDGKVFINNQDSPILNSEEVIESLLIKGNKLVLGTADGLVLILDLGSGLSQRITGTGNSKIIFIDSTVNTLTIINENGNIIKINNGVAKIVKSLNIAIVDASYSNSNLVLLGKNSLLTLDPNYQIIQEIELKEPSNATALGVNGIYAVGFSSGKIILYDVLEGKPIQYLHGHNAAITSIDLNQRYIASGSFDRSARVWLIDQIDQQPMILQDHESWVSKVTLTESAIYTGQFNGTLKKWPLEYQVYAESICQHSIRNLTREEWNKYIGNDVPFENTCNVN